LVRAPLWLIGVLLMAAVVVGVYAYFTTPLPFGLSGVIRTPGGEAALPTAVATPALVGARTPAGQPLVLGATSVAVQSVLRNQDLAANNRGGPPGTFTVLDVMIQNGGALPLAPKVSDFQLMDDRGRTYAVDSDATRSVNATARRRVLFDAGVPPTASLQTLLAFETPADAGALTLRVSLGYGDLELAR
jgi:hypothetical protein